MKKWEYKVVDLQIRQHGTLIDDHGIEDLLDSFGAEGWELVSVTEVQTYHTSHKAYLKREKA